MKETKLLFKVLWFSSNLVCAGVVPGQSSVLKGLKHGMKGAKALGITVGDCFVHFSARLGDLP